MAFKMTKQQKKQLEDVRSTLEAKETALENAVQEMQDAMEEARVFLEDFVQEVQSDYDEKSDKWKEGDVAQQAQEWIAMWEEVTSDLEQEVDITIPDWRDMLDKPTASDEDA